MIVVDASAVADLLVDAGPNGRWARERVVADDSLHAPDLLDYEVLSVLRRRSLRAELTPERAHRALDDFGALPLRRYPPLLDRMWRLPETLTAYDAAYVALAEALDAPLITTDLRLLRSHGHDARVVGPPAA